MGFRSAHSFGLLIGIFLLGLELFAQNQSSLSFSYGLNLSLEKNLEEVRVYVYGAKPVYLAEYEFQLKYRYGFRYNIGYTNFNAHSFDFNVPSESWSQYLTTNIGFSHYYFRKNRINLSSGFYLGYYYGKRYAKALDQEFIFQNFSYSISVARIDYRVINNISIKAEVCVGKSLLSNYILGFTAVR
jgi:hypothetical protein